MSSVKKGIHFITHNQATTPGGLNSYQKMLGGLGMQRPLNFSYADADGILMPGLSIEENILIDSMPISQYREHHFSLEQHLVQLNNAPLSELFQRLLKPKNLAQQCDPQTRKIATLIKALLREAPYLFLDFPERHLEQDVQKIFTRALEIQVSAKSQMCLITSDQEITWRKVATSLIILDKNNKWTTAPSANNQLIGTFLVTLEDESEVANLDRPYVAPHGKVS